MALVDKNDMTTLRPASDSKATAETAEQDIQLKALAYAINNAANCGQTNVIFQERILDANIAELKSKGYTIRQDRFVSSTERSTLIEWSE